jgi:predicted thioesterase
VGLGDWIMATAEVKQAHVARGGRVLVVGANNKVQWSEIFENNPKITRDPRSASCRVINGPGCRPYIANRSQTRWTWRRERNQQPGEIYLSDGEARFAETVRGKILSEPNVKANGHANKAWPFERWQELVDQIGEPMVQVGGMATRWLRNVQRVETVTFRLACAVLSVSRAFVGTEGALHHAAAAFGVPAVVLFSEFISPDVTGYGTQINIRHAGEPCGSRVPCAGCAASMMAIDVDEVAHGLRRAIE